MKTEVKFAIFVYVLVFFIAVLPVIFMFKDAFLNIFGDGFSFVEFFSTKSVLLGLKNSFFLSITVATITTVLGTAFGVLFTKTDFYLSRLFVFLLVIHLLLPPYIIALGWIDVVGVNGVFSKFLFGFGGSAFILSSIYLPIPLLLSIFFLKQINPNLENVALLSSSFLSVLKHITIPLITPAIWLSFSIVFILTFGEYSVANTLRFYVFPLEVFTLFSAFYDFNGAVVMTLPMLVVSFFILFLINRNSKKISYRHTNNINVITLTKREQIFFSIVGFIFIFFSVILPLVSMFITIESFENFYIALLKAYEPLKRSFIFAFFSSLLLSFMGILSGYIIVSKVRFYKFLDLSIMFLFILPSAILAIALVLFWNGKYVDFVYTSPLIIIFGYFSKYLLFSTKIVENKILQLEKNIIDAGKIFGANWFEVLVYIIIPSSKNMFFTIFMISFIFSMKESTITSLVYPAGYDTLPIYILTQMANSQPEVIASLCVILMLSILIPFSMLIYLSKKGKL